MKVISFDIVGEVVKLPCPNSSKFSIASVAPYIEDGKLYIYDALGIIGEPNAPCGVITQIKKNKHGLIVCEVSKIDRHDPDPITEKFYLVCLNGEWERKPIGDSSVQRVARELGLQPWEL